MKRLIAVNDHIIVEVLQEVEEVITDGGIVIPEIAVKSPQGYGRIISVGAQVTIPVGIGDIIIFHKNGGMDIMIGNKILKVLKQPEVYAQVQEIKEVVS